MNKKSNREKIGKGNELRGKEWTLKVNIGGRKGEAEGKRRKDKGDKRRETLAERRRKGKRGGLLCEASKETNYKEN